MKRKSKTLKRTIKFLSGTNNPHVVSSVIANSSDPVIKSICNAALNVAKGSVHLKKKQKKILSANRELIQQLIQKGEPVQAKRKILVQSGGSVLAALVPTILSVVLSSLGSALFK